MCGAVTQLKSDGVTQARLFGSGVAGVHTIAQDKVATVKYLSTLALAAHRTVPTSSLHAFQAATYRIGANLQTAVQIVNNGITGLRSPAIDAVEPTVPVCVALR